jgi:site-specific recombinase XerC
MRAYVGRGLREDLARLEDSEVNALVASLRRRGVDEALLAKALSEVSGK